MSMFYINPGETWKTFPWNFAAFTEIADSGEALANTTLDVSVESGATGITIANEAVSGNTVTFDITVSSSAASGARVLLCEVGTDGNPVTILTDRATFSVGDIFAIKQIDWIADADRLCAVDFTGHPCILAGQILTGTPTITFDDDTDITISEEAIDTTNDYAVFRIGVASTRTIGRRIGKCSVGTTAGSTLISYFDLTLR